MTSDITIVSLGPGNPDLLNAVTIRTLRNAGELVLRTGRHPLSSWLTENGIPFSTMDFLYDTMEDFDQLNERIVSILLKKASVSPIVYAVPDAPTDRSVRTLYAHIPSSVRISTVPGVGIYDACTAVSLPFLSGQPLLVVPASDMLSGFFHDPNNTLLITELDNPILTGEIKIILSDMLDDLYQVYLLNGSDPPVPIPLYELDRKPGIDHRTSVLVPGSGFRERNRFVMSDLAEIMETLRSPDGCPWDRAQTHSTLRPYMVEEAWECVAAIDDNDSDHLCEELGDLLFQVVFHASIGRSFDEFSLGDVFTAVCAKMIRRHPHVFGSAKADSPESVRAAWEKIKEEETGHQTVVRSLDDVAEMLPSLKYTSKTLKKLLKAEYPGDSSRILSDIREYAGVLATDRGKTGEEALGVLLLLCAVLCFLEDVDSELALHRAADRLRSLVVSSEKSMKKQGKSLEHLTFDELRVYLKHVKGEIE